MSKAGTFIAFAAEAALWVTGAALIASAAGMHWSVNLSGSDIGGLVGARSSASASAGSSREATVSLAPGASPTISPVAQKFRAYVARTDWQFRAKYSNVDTFSLNGKPTEFNQNGTMSYKAGDAIDSSRETMNGAVTTEDYVYIGKDQYESKNGGGWTKTARPPADAANDKLLFAPSMQFVDMGTDTKNGRELHRLEVADPVAFSKAMVQTSASGVTAAQMTITVWVGDDGAPAAIEVAGWEEEPMSGVSTRITADEQFRIVATSGVVIAAPI